MTKKTFVKKQLNEGLADDAARAEHDHEVQMARADCFYAARDAIELHKLLSQLPENFDLDGWVTAKLTLAADYLKTVKEYMGYQAVSGELSAQVAATPAPVMFEQRLAEMMDSGVEAVRSALTRRIMMRHSDLLAKHGLDAVEAAIDSAANFYGPGIEEIGTSDLNAMMNYVISELGGSMNEGHMSEVDMVLQDVAAGLVDPQQLLSAPQGPEEEMAADMLKQKMEKVAAEQGMDMERDFDAILDIVSDEITQEHGSLLEMTSAGGIATVAMPMGKPQKRKKIKEIGPAGTPAAAAAGGDQAKIAQKLKQSGNQQLANKLKTAKTFNQDEVSAIMAASK